MTQVEADAANMRLSYTQCVGRSKKLLLDFLGKEIGSGMLWATQV